MSLACISQGIGARLCRRPAAARAQPAAADASRTAALPEAFSEFGIRKGNLVSCKARVEIKAIEKATGKVLAVDRQTSVAVDLSQQMAAKAALQYAAAELAERVLPRIAN